MQRKRKQVVASSASGVERDPPARAHARPVSPDEEAKQELVRWCREHDLPIPPPASESMLLRQ